MKWNFKWGSVAGHKMAALEALQKVCRCNHHLEFAGLISAADKALHPVIMPSLALRACKDSKISRCHDNCPPSSMAGTYFSSHMNSSSRGQWGWMPGAVHVSLPEHWNLPSLSSFSGAQNTAWLLKVPLVLVEAPVFVWKCSSGLTRVPVVSGVKWCMFMPMLFQQRQYFFRAGQLFFCPLPSSFTTF